MIRLAVINERKSSTREEANTIDRAIGELVLSKLLNENEYSYAGYIVADTKMSPQWLIENESVDFTLIKSELINMGYRAKVIKNLMENIDN